MAFIAKNNTIGNQLIFEPFIGPMVNVQAILVKTQTAAIIPKCKDLLPFELPFIRLHVFVIFFSCYHYASKQNPGHYPFSFTVSKRLGVDYDRGFVVKKNPCNHLDNIIIPLSFSCVNGFNQHLRTS